MIDSDFVVRWKWEPCDRPTACSLSTLSIRMCMSCASTDFILLETGLMVVRAQWNTWIKEAKTEMTVWEAPSRDRGTAHEESSIRNRDIRNADSVHEESPIRNRPNFKNNGGLLHEEAPIRIRDLRTGGSVHDDAPHRSRGRGLVQEEAPHRSNRDLRNNGGFVHDEALIRNRDVRNGGALYEEAPHRTRDFRNGGSVHVEALFRNRESRIGVSVHEEAPIRNRESRIGVLVHEEEAPVRSPDARNGGSVVHEETQRLQSPLNTSPVRDLKHLDTPPSVKKVDMRNDLLDAYKVQPKRRQPMFEHVNNNGNISNRETLEVSERKLEEGQVEQSNPKEMMMDGSKRQVGVEDDVQFENKTSERREFVQIEEDSDGGRDMDMDMDLEGESGDEHVFKPGEHGGCEGIPRMGDTVANVLVNRDKKLRLRKLSEKKSVGKGSFPQKTPGRRGRPPGRSHSLLNSRQPFSQGNQSFSALCWFLQENVLHYKRSTVLMKLLKLVWVEECRSILSFDAVNSPLDIRGYLWLFLITLQRSLVIRDYLWTFVVICDFSLDILRIIEGKFN